MDGVNTYNCQCPPEWTGMKTALYTMCVCVCLLSLVLFSTSGADSQILIQEQIVFGTFRKFRHLKILVLHANYYY